jgi:hypothetical protein
MSVIQSDSKLNVSSFNNNDIKKINLKIKEKSKDDENHIIQKANLSSTDQKVKKFKSYLEIHNSGKKFMSFSLIELLKICLFKQNKLAKDLQRKDNLFKAYINELAFSREINKLIELQFKFDFFQSILLNEHQIQALHHINYRSIYEKQQLQNSKDDGIKQLLNLHSHYQKLLSNKDNLSIVDEKIFSNLDDDLISIIG